VGAKPKQWGRLRLSVDARSVARIVPIVQFDHVALQVPDIAAALAWWQAMVPAATVLYEDETWALLEAGGSRLAFVMADQHPNHLAFKVSSEELDARAAAGEADAPIASHRDGTRSFYRAAPGGHRVELIAYPDVVAEDAE
jgi:catechol 2,3-dioxygenase-like lactoylglutathione lyase family enzyme